MGFVQMRHEPVGKQQDLKMVSIRAATTADAQSLFAIVRAAAADDQTLPFTDMSTAMCEAHWFGSHQAWVAIDQDGDIVGVYKLGENYPDRGSHVASATYIVAAHARGLGVGRSMVEHSLEQARERGFKAIQFNYVVANNAAAIALYQKLGFSIVGRIPQAFKHDRDGLVDVCVMHRFL